MQSLGLLPLPAVGVYETVGDRFVRRAGFRFGGDRVFADRFAGCLEPLFPFFGLLWFTVGVEQEFTAERASSVLPLEEVQTQPIQRWRPAVLPFIPVVGQGRVIT